MKMLTCWVVLTLGMLSKSTIINSPLLSFEVSQSGFGMYVKYLMAGFLAIFAISMMIQFASYLLESIADYRGEPNGHQAEEDGDEGDDHDPLLRRGYLTHHLLTT